MLENALINHCMHSFIHYVFISQFLEGNFFFLIPFLRNRNLESEKETLGKSKWKSTYRAITILLSCIILLWLGVHFQLSNYFSHRIYKLRVERTKRISQVTMNLRKLSEGSLTRFIMKKTHVSIFQISFLFAQKKQWKIVAS